MDQITAYLIPADQAEPARMVTLDAGDRLLSSLYSQIGCRIVESVSLDGEMDMILDEEALLGENPVANPRASWVAALLGDPRPLFGNAVIVAVVGDDLDNWGGLTAEQMNMAQTAYNVTIRLLAPSN